MTKETIFQDVGSFIRSQLNDPFWDKAMLNFEIQPDAQSYDFSVFIDGKRISRVFEPDDEIRLKLLMLHKLTSMGKNSHWNAMQFEVNNASAYYNVEFSWDQEKQSKIDRIDKEKSKKNPNYKPAKWDWEMSNQEILDQFFQRLKTTINNYLWGVSFKKAQILIKKRGKDFEFSGRYISDKGEQKEKIAITPYYVLTAGAYKLWDISTNGGSENDHWNLAVFTLYSNGNYVIEYEKNDGLKS